MQPAFLARASRSPHGPLAIPAVRRTLPPVENPARPRRAFGFLCRADWGTCFVSPTAPGARRVSNQARRSRARFSTGRAPPSRFRFAPRFSLRLPLLLPLPGGVASVDQDRELVVVCPGVLRVVDRGESVDLEGL